MFGFKFTSGISIVTFPPLRILDSYGQQVTAIRIYLVSLNECCRYACVYILKSFVEFLMKYNIADSHKNIATAYSK